MKKNVCVLLAILSVGLLIGIVGIVAGSEEKENEIIIKKTSDGGYLGMIEICSDGKNQCYISFIETDKNGTEKWSKTFNVSRGSYSKLIQQTSDGGCVAISNMEYRCSDRVVLSCNVRLTKKDADGIEEWNRTLGETNEYKFGESIQQTSDGGYVIVGYKISGYDSDIWLIKTSVNGTEEWNKIFATDLGDSGKLILQTSDGGYSLVGIGNSLGNCNAKLWIIKTSANGTMEWSKKSGGSGVPYGKSIHQTSDGYIITGSTEYSKGRGHIDWIIRTDVNGTEVWKKTFGKLKTPPPNQIFAPAPASKTPGFESIFAIGGIAIVCLLRMRKREKLRR